MVFISGIYSETAGRTAAVIPQNNVILIGGIIVITVIDKSRQRRGIEHRGFLEASNTGRLEQGHFAVLFIALLALELPYLIINGIDRICAVKILRLGVPSLCAPGHHDEIKILIIFCFHTLYQIPCSGTIVFLQVGADDIKHHGARLYRFCTNNDRCSKYRTQNHTECEQNRNALFHLRFPPL